MELQGEKINKIVFAHYDEMKWISKTYVKDISVDYKSVRTEPKKDLRLYSWNEALGEKMIGTGGLEANGGSWSSAATDVEFDSGEGAILLNNNGSKNNGKFEYFNFNSGMSVENGELKLSCKFKMNGSYFGIILDSGDGVDSSTPVLTINPWGQDNIWKDVNVVDKFSGEIKTGDFPWNATELAESLELGQHSDDGFGPWLTAEVSAKPREQKYSLLIKNGETVIAEGTDLPMRGAQIQGIVFAYFDDMDWDAKTYVKDLYIDYKSEFGVNITKITNEEGENALFFSNDREKLTTWVSMKNGSGEEKKINVLAAVYGESGKLVKLFTGETKSSSKDAEFSESFDFEDLSQAKKIKFFVWESLGGMMPYAEPVSLPRK